MRLYAIINRPETTLCITHLDGNYAQFGRWDQFIKVIDDTSACQYCGATSDTPDGLADRIMNNLDAEKHQAGLRLVDQLLNSHERLEWDQHQGPWVVVYDDPVRREEAYLGLTLIGPYPDRPTAEAEAEQQKKDLNRGLTEGDDIEFDAYVMPLFPGDR